MDHAVINEGDAGSHPDVAMALGADSALGHFGHGVYHPADAFHV